MPRVSIIIVHRDRWNEVRKCIDSLQLQTFRDYDVWIVDNNSRSMGAFHLPTEMKNINLIRIGLNAGVPGCNFGAEKATGEILVFLDSDAYLEPETLAHCVREFNLHEDVWGGVAFTVIDPKDGRIVFPFRKGLAGSPCFYHSFMGCAYAFRGKVFLESDKYDEDLPIYGTEEDISIRVLDIGYQIKYAPQCVAYHEGGHPKYNRPDLFMELIVAHTLWHFIHYYPFKFMVLYAIKDILKKSNRAFRGKTFRPFLRGLVNGLRHIPREWKKRKVSPHWNWVDLYLHVFNKQICHR